MSVTLDSEQFAAIVASLEELKLYAGVAAVACGLHLGHGVWSRFVAYVRHKDFL